jgi:hypothetical protein
MAYNWASMWIRPRPAFNSTAVRTLSFALAFIPVFAGLALGQHGAKRPQTINIKATPASSLVGGIITLRGNVNGSGNVQLTITPPSNPASPPTLTAIANSKGDFNVVFQQTQMAGTYQVRAVAPDGNAQATTTFVIQQPQVIQVSVSPKFVTLPQQNCSGPMSKPPSVTISGNTDTSSTLKVVTILIAPATTLKAQANFKGDFSIAYTPPQKLGTYKIQAISPDGTGKSTTSLEVKAATDQSSPVTLEVFDSSPGPGDEITIKGTTPPDGAGPVKLTLVQPSGTKLSFDIPAASGAVPSGMENKFSFCTNNTPKAGEYGVCVDSPGGHYTGSTTFEVGADFSPPGEDPKLADLAVKLIEQIKNLDGSLPDSPAKAQLDDETVSETSKVLGALAGLDAFNAQLKVLVQLRIDYPNESAIFEPLIKDLEEWQQLATQEEFNLNQLLGNAQSSLRCDDVQKLIDELKKLRGLFVLIKAKLAVVIDYEKKWSNITSGLPTDDLGESQLRAAADANSLTLEDLPQCINGLVSSAKAPDLPEFLAALKDREPSDGPLQYFQDLIDGLDSTIGGMSDNIFKAYCQKFQGPFTAAMHAETLLNGQPWWKYDVGLKGELTLRYENTGKTSEMSGDFAGTVTRLNAWEDAFAVFVPSLQRSAMLSHRTIQASPGASFDVPVRGTLTGSQMTITLLDATTDYNESAFVHYLIVSPLAIVPVFQQFTLPYKDAHFILSRALGDGPAQITVAMDAHAMKIVKTFNNTHSGKTSAGVGTAKYMLNVTACNPICSSLPDSPKQKTKPQSKAK